MASTEEVIRKINENKELKDYQKDAIIKAIQDDEIDPQKFLEEFFSANIRQFLGAAEFFPRRISDYLLIEFIDAELQHNIHLLPTETKFRSIILNYFNKSRMTPEEKYNQVSDLISELWSYSEKNPSIFENLKNFEPILQNIPNYRDHFIHSSYVFIMGYILLNKMRESLDGEFSQFFKSNEPNLTWMLTSTFHDVAYPIEKIDLWLNGLLESFIGITPKNVFNYENVFPHIYFDFMKMISRYHKNYHDVFSVGMGNSGIDWAFYNEINKKFLDKNHGVLSGLILAHNLAIREGFIEKDREWNFFYNQLPACHAICSHTMNYQIDFVKFPISFLLVLCDEIQDWGRPTKQTNQDVIYLKKIEVKNTEVPEINLKIAISSERKETLSKVLTRRLQTNGRIRVIIKDIHDNLVLQL